MLSRLHAAGLVWPTICALGALAVLLGLGTWQMQRKAWKDGLIAAIATRAKAPLVPLVPALLAGSADGIGAEYLRVRTAGTFLNDQERHLYMPGKEGPGWHIITPMAIADGHGVVLVNRGWVPDALKEPSSRTSGQFQSTTAVEGFIRLPERPGYFIPANDPVRNIWFWRDIEAMLTCRNAPADSLSCRVLSGAYHVGYVRYPLVVDAANPLPRYMGPWPRAGTTNFALPNRHLEYALTWYGLALTLIGVYVAFARGRLRAPRERAAS